MIEPINVPIILDVEEAEEYGAQLASLITINKVYGGLPSEGIAGDILIKNSEEDYDASWCAPASAVEDGNGLPVTSDAVYDAVSVKYTKPSNGIPADDLAERAISSRIWWTNGQITYRMTMKTIPISQLDNNTPTPGGVPLVPRAGDIVVGPKIGATDGVPRYLYTIGDILQGTPYGDLAVLQDFASSDYEGAYVGPLKVSELQNDSGFGTYSKPSDGIPASDLANDVHLIPSGGTTGQVLKKASSTNYDTEWVNENGGAFIVTVTYSDDAYSADKTFAQIKSALQDGMEVSVVYGYFWYKLTFITESPSFALFSRINGTETETFYIDDQGNVSSTVTTLGTYSKPSGGIPSTDLASGIAVPSGGTTGQVLKKVSGTNYDTEWADESGGISDYSDLTNKPQINSVTLSGNKSLSDLGIEPETFVVTVTESNGIYSADKTATQIIAAANANRRVIAMVGVTCYQLFVASGGEAYFTAIYNNTSRLLKVGPGSTATVSLLTIGTYSLPSGGIPETDLASDVQAKLDSAYNAFPLDTASGAMASFHDGADNVPVKDLTIAIESVQSGSGDPAPDNVRPISGWTSANVKRTGKNLLDVSAVNSLSNNGITLTIADGEITMNGAASENAYFSVLNLGLKSTNGFSYSARNSVANNGVHISLRASDGTYFGDNGLSTVNKTAYMSSNTDCNSFIIYVVAGTELTNFKIKPQLERGPATTYEPYSGNTYAITFPSAAGTVYGGTLDVTTGTLTVTHASDTLRGSETIAESSTNGFMMIGDAFNEFMYKYDIPGAQPYPIPICSHYKGVAYQQSSGLPVGVCDCFSGAQGHSIGFKTTFDTTQEFAAYLAAQNTNGTPVRFVLPLRTPRTYQLTPQEVATLLGTNNIWADTGDSTVDYRADPTLYIAAIEDEMSGYIEKPSSPSSGDFLCWNGTTWAATSLSTWQGGNY